MRRKAVEETEVVDRSSPANLDRTEFPADKIRRLTRRVPEADEAVEPQSKAPEDREPEAEPSGSAASRPCGGQLQIRAVGEIVAAAHAVCPAAGGARRRRLFLRHRRQGDVDRQRLCAGRHGRHLDRCLRHRPRARRCTTTTGRRRARCSSRLDELPFQIALDGAEAQLGTTRNE